MIEKGIITLAHKLYVYNFAVNHYLSAFLFKQSDLGYKKI